MALLKRDCCVCGGPFLEDEVRRDWASVCPNPTCMATFKRVTDEALRAHLTKCVLEPRRGPCGMRHHADDCDCQGEGGER